MRKSVLTGVFACALVFIVNSNNANAMDTNSTEKSSNSSLIKIEKIEDLTETPKSPLFTMVNEKADVKISNSETETSNQNREPLVHVVQPEESLSVIAAKYQTTWDRIYDKNPEIINPDILNVGMKIIIPFPEEQLQKRELPKITQEPEVKVKNVNKVNPEVNESSKTLTNTAGNGYIAGYCTWYVKNRRPDMPNNLGNASTWVSRAASQGMATGSTPAVGAVGQKGNHVVYVESVNVDGTVTISEMNHKGRYVMTTRTVPASYFQYIY